MAVIDAIKHVMELKGMPMPFIPAFTVHLIPALTMPRQVSADGGFTSRANLAWAKGEGVRDVCFSKRRGFSVLEMVRSHWVFKKLRNLRAGIEANISRLKRAFGLSRCNWSGWAGFRQYVWSAVVAYNLSVLARHQMAAA